MVETTRVREWMVRIDESHAAIDWVGSIVANALACADVEVPAIVRML